MSVSWIVQIGDEFKAEFDALHEDLEEREAARRLKEEQARVSRVIDVE